MPFKKGQPGGPGRPRKKDKFDGQIAKAEAWIADRLPQFLENMAILANGVFVEETTDEGKRFVYQRAPDRQANEYLINRIMGKPTDRKEHTFPDKPLEEMSEDELRAIRDS
jgi:hypothetical protein